MEATLYPIYDQHVNCAYCKKSYTTKKVRSRFTRPIHTDSDFCTTYQNETFSPLLYNVQVCPECGYACTNQFKPYFSEEARQTIHDKITAKWSPKNYGIERSIDDAIETYKLAIYAGTLKKESSVVLAGMYLRLAWIYRKKEDMDQELRFLRLALSSYTKAYEEDNIGSEEMTPTKILYLMGELNRRLSNYQKAIKYFSILVDKKVHANEPHIVKLAREQWQQTRQDMNEK